MTPRPSLGIPTWLYGHEPPTIFATCIAKYFDNSAREDGLVSIARRLIGESGPGGSRRGARGTLPRDAPAP